jgi:hypothetical protein
MTEETIVAVFETAAHADAAVRDLEAANVPSSAISRHSSPDQPDAAHGVQAGATPDRGPDDIGADVDGLDGLSAGSQHG